MRRPPQSLTKLALVSLALLACSPVTFPTREELRPDGGGVGIMGRTNDCPVVTADVEPAVVHWGEPVKASAFHATDPDNEVLTYAWSASSGTFVDAKAGETYFMCTVPGPVTLTIVVTDRSGCSEKAALGIFCLGKPDGGAAGTGPTTGAAGSTGSTGSAGSSGNPDGGVPQENMCPKEQGSDSCNECTSNNCSLGETGTDGCCGLTNEADRKLCQTAVACIARNGPSCVMSGDATVCFCGTSNQLCFSQKGKANGPCVAEMVAAAKTDDPATILNRLVSPLFPIGRAVNLTACRGGLCGMECGL
jgi:hypothetical protein